MNNAKNIQAYNYLHNIALATKVRDPLWSTIHVLPPLSPLLYSTPMQRLTRIKQLGPTHLVYPSATHTRFAHSIGVYHLAKMILMHILLDPHCPSLSITEVLSFLAAALLHDIGHFPYTHSLKTLPLPEHEQLSAKIIMHTLAPLLSEHNIDPTLTAAIIDPDVTTNIKPQYNKSLILFQNLLSGVMDPDKLDYLCRDAFFSGVPYGIQDISYAIQHLYITSDYTIGSKSTLPLEHILFSKYLMYRSVYWHKKVRCATAMIKKALYHALTQGDLEAQQLTQLDDTQFFDTCIHIKTPYMELVSRVYNNELYNEVFIEDYDPKFEHLSALAIRSNYEKAIAKLLGLSLVVIDIPEHITFEVPKEGSIIFPSHTIQRSIQSIRKVRIFAPSQKPINDTLYQQIYALISK